MRIACTLNNTDETKSNLDGLLKSGWVILPKYTTDKDKENKSLNLIYKSKKDIDRIEKMGMIAVKNGSDIFPVPSGNRGILLCDEEETMNIFSKKFKNELKIV